MLLPSWYVFRMIVLRSTSDRDKPHRQHAQNFPDFSRFSLDVLWAYFPPPGPGGYLKKLIFKHLSAFSSKLWPTACASQFTESIQ